MNRPTTRTTSDLSPPGEVKTWSIYRIVFAYLLMLAIASGSIILIDHYAMAMQTGTVGHL